MFVLKKIIYFASIIGVGCSFSKGNLDSKSANPLATHQALTTVLFINLKFTNPADPTIEIASIARNGGYLKQTSEKQTRLEEGDFVCTFLASNGDIVGVSQFPSPLQRLMEVSDEKGVIQRVQVERQEEYWPIRINDPGNITHLKIEYIQDGKLNVVTTLEIR